ncbi:MAG: stage V sporulation protein AD, partial [Clostridia bacterium]|nr:stage V sporulation protein AD [Clostridia bacterium]
AMARAAYDSVFTYLSLTESSVYDFDAIFTGDLGSVGSEIFKELISKDFPRAAEIHLDCGNLLFDTKKKNLGAGASGCGCSASVLSALILPKIKRGELKNILFLSTGALMNSGSVLQGESILGIAPVINIRKK